jgi:hypothetical protein
MAGKEKEQAGETERVIGVWNGMVSRRKEFPPFTPTVGGQHDVNMTPARKFGGYPHSSPAGDRGAKVRWYFGISFSIQLFRPAAVSCHCGGWRIRLHARERGERGKGTAVQNSADRDGEVLFFGGLRL